MLCLCSSREHITTLHFRHARDRNAELTEARGDNKIFLFFIIVIMIVIIIISPRDDNGSGCDGGDTNDESWGWCDGRSKERNGTSGG